MSSSDTMDSKERETRPTAPYFYNHAPPRLNTSSLEQGTAELLWLGSLGGNATSNKYVSSLSRNIVIFSEHFIDCFQILGAAVEKSTCDYIELSFRNKTLYGNG